MVTVTKFSVQNYRYLRRGTVDGEAVVEVMQHCSFVVDAAGNTLCEDEFDKHSGQLKNSFPLILKKSFKN